MNKKDLYILILLVGVFLLLYFIPLGMVPIEGPLFEALALLQEYVREHVLLCLVPAFFIAGGIAVFIRQESVLRYFGARANKFLAYGVASISGTILAVCSCTVLPVFGGIYKRGAGLGPATAFLYSGPAINIMAIILTARVLGWELGLARAIGAVLFSIVIGLMMHLIFLKEEKAKHEGGPLLMENEESEKPVWQNILLFAGLIAFLIFAGWYEPGENANRVSVALYNYKWILAGIALAGVIITSKVWFSSEERKDWFESTWGFTRQITPYLFIGILIAGFLLGRPQEDGIIPARFIHQLVGGNSLRANFFASIAAAFMYFVTLTEIPILEGLLGSGMGHGPALALLLAGPALSLPNMLVLRSILGWKRTAVFIVLVVIMATISGFIFGHIGGIT